MKPTSLIADPVVAEKKKNSLLQICCDSGRIFRDDADKVKLQFSAFHSGLEDEPIKLQFVSYDVKSTRLDILCTITGK